MADESANENEFHTAAYMGMFFRREDTHRVTRREIVNAFAPYTVDPISGQLGARRVSPLFIAALETNGYDPEPYVKQLLADAEEVDRALPTDPE